MIDTHLHLWDPATIRRAWLADAPELNRPYLIGDYRSLAEAVGITASVHVETDVDDSELDRELHETAIVMSESSMVRAMVVGGRPGAPGFGAWLERTSSASAVVGLRRVFHGLDGKPDRFLTTALVEDLVLLGERGLHFELCVRPDQLEAATELVDACPRTRFVLDHLGRPEVASGPTAAWSEGMRRIADRGNVVAKLSGLIECSAGVEWTTDAFRPFLEFALDRFGSERIVWGSNWPVCEVGGSLARWVAATRSLLAGQPESVQQAVLEDNARRVYRLG